MRSRLARLFLRWAQRLDPLSCAALGLHDPLPSWDLSKVEPDSFLANQELIKAAIPLVKAAEQFAAGTSGEFKRHWVYAQLVKQFPRHPKHEIGLRLEQTVSALRR